ncbi:MAG: hypothetical protein N2Z74_08395 [Syntrophales bacterium]|nr:hypothetical protein [Syntrophales bacterium]
MADAVVVLQTLAGLVPAGQNLFPQADVNGDGKLGLAEVLYVIQSISANR